MFYRTLSCRLQRQNIVRRDCLLCQEVRLRNRLPRLSLPRDEVPSALRTASLGHRSLRGCLRGLLAHPGP